ncbi:alpha-amylase family glycosyl hydrolase [Paenibacillus hexagrammi]|uniref:Alpha-amylase n=1 Tax=Paenibacillus hexagrammi TaxID=2908839 RepID=A0ABY3SGC2_9BACL|nr:alpha-amylase family glycosyl hydrolase [Paenibacillus sp. YPD9-1]UJF32764.1 alpha-amylase [Paenibacillus sp. YPD9-1]
MTKSKSKQHRRVWSLVTALLLVVQLLAGLRPLAAYAADGPVADPLTSQPGGTNWVVVGSFQGWSNNSADTRMAYLGTGFYEYSTVLPAGHHEFKMVKSGTWEGFSDSGGNYGLDLAETSKVNFYLNEKTNQARISVPGVHGLSQYIPALSADKWPRLVGDIQSVFGEPVWSPDSSNQYFVDYNFDGTVYKLQCSLPIGKYKAKVIFGSNWTDSESYGDPNNTSDDQNLVVNVLDPADVTFSIDYSASPRALTHDYVAKDSAFDGLINQSSIKFDSRSITYKKPFGAIKQGQEDLTLRIAAQQGDVQLAKVELTSPDGISSNFTMNRVTSTNQLDYFETILPKTAFSKIGVWGYKFILIDGSTKVEYGDDSSRGGTGSVTNEGAVPFDLTVYDSSFQTPDWMKNAVVYQIFPDRFFDGDKSNNRAKLLDGYRGVIPNGDATSKGGQKLQYFDGGVPNDPAADQVWGQWSDVPENPDRITPENKPYFPNAKSDGAWTNEFYGGDIQGVQQKLSYLKSLGITTIYLNPVSWAASNHKYDATDYGHLDPMFGEPVYNTPGDPTSGLNYTETRAKSDRVYQLFAKEARDLGMHILNDGVFNHVGDDSIYFDRYSKYPEIGAYEYWAKVFDMMKAQNITQSDAETAVRADFESQMNPLTGVNYKYPDDFRYISWFTVTSNKVKNHDDDGLHYAYDAWWGYDSLPAMDAKEPQLSATDYYPADTDSIPGQHEWNNIGYREAVIGHDLNGLTDPQAEQKMQETNSQRWLWMGSSGWRLDVAPDVSHGTWQQFRKAVKSATGRTDANGNPIEEPVILGEEWGVATPYLLGDQFDSVMNYRFRNAVQGFISSGDAATMNQALESIREDYPKEAWQAMLNLVDSHDTTRSITKYDHTDWEEEHKAIAPDATDKALKQQALTAIMQLGYPGAPTVYYGDEVGLTGTKDPDSRRTFPWERIADNGNGTFSGAGRYAELFGTYQKAAELRNNNDVFRTGDLKVAYANGDVVVYARKSDTKGALVAVNRGANAQTVQADVAGFLPDGLNLTDQLGGVATGTVTSGKVSLTIPALSGMMMLSDTSLSSVAQVTNLHAQGNNGNVSVSWDTVTGADSYHVYRAAIEGGDLQLVGDVTGTSWTDVNVQNGTKYYYTVTARLGANESTPCDMAAATPAFVITSVQTVQEATYMDVGVGRLTSEIKVSVNVPGLTDNAAYAGVEAPGLITKLFYYPSTSTIDQASETKLRYKSDDAGTGSKIYWSQFEPTYAGTYLYQAKVSSDNGETYVSSPTVTLQVYADSHDMTPPAAPVLNDIQVESNLAHLRWSLDDTDVSGIEVYRKDGTNDYHLVTTLAKTDREYVDYTVSNDTAYTYKVVAFDQAYNRASSAEKQVTPKLVMVDVKLRLHLPDYTPTTDGIFIAGDFNGWSASSTALKVPSGATDRSVVEYSFKMMAGKAIQYKYTRGDWDKEAFTSHQRLANDTVDPGNWAYSSTNTNMMLTISNQGDNQMVVDDYVLRWVDMPMMISLPRTSYGSDISYTTDESSMNLKAVVPFGVAFTINNQPIAAESMDAHGNVEVNNIPLNFGENQFVLHIEPTAETLALPFYEDKGRASQATKSLTINVTRTGESGGKKHNGSGSSGSSSTTDSNKQSVTLDQMKPNDKGRATVSLGAGMKELRLPIQASSAAGTSAVEVKGETVSVTLPSDVLKAASDLLTSEEQDGAEISLSVNKLDDTAKQEAKKSAVLPKQTDISFAGDVYDFTLSVVTKDGKTMTLSKFSKPVTLTFHVNADADAQMTGVYYISDSGQLEYIGGAWSNGELAADVTHFSRYAALEYHKTYADVPANHWASKPLAC